MEDRATKLTGVYQETGFVRAVVGSKVVVETSTGQFEARLAASCTLVPAPGDLVLVAVPAEGSLFVLAVLTRADETTPQIWRIPEGVRVESEGEVSLFGLAGVQIRSPATVEMSAKTLEMSAMDSVVSTQNLSVGARQIQFHADSVKGSAKSLDTMLERVTQHVKRCYRFIEELDLTRAEQIDTRVTSTMTLRAKNAFVAAEELVKIDGTQIHLG